MKKKQLNPAATGLTGAESEVYKIIKKRQKSGNTITSGDVAELWGNKNRSYTYRVIQSLIGKGLVERYSQRYYRLVESN